MHLKTRNVELREKIMSYLFQGKLTVLDVLHESEIISNEITVGNKFTHRRASEMRYKRYNNRIPEYIVENERNI